MKYAQIVKASMSVNLIGGKEVGLPIEHPAVMCVDITDRPEVEINMKYDPDTDTFHKEIPPEPTPEPPTVEDRLMAVEEALLMIL